MNKNIIRIFLLFLFTFYNLNIGAKAQIILLSGCKNFKDGFIKNEYVLDLEKSLMIRNFIYDAKTYKKYRVTDLSTKKKIQLKNLSMNMII